MSEKAPFSPRLKSIIAALWTGQIFAPFLVTGVAAMLPAIGESLGASAVALSLVMVCYNLGQGIAHILSGRISSIIGVKRLLIIGLFLFCSFGVLLGLAPNMPLAIFLRFTQGISAAAIACCVTTLSLVVAPPEQRSQVIGIVMTAVYLGLAAGPLCCGGLTELTGWRTVFFILAAIGAVEIVFLARMLPPDRDLADGRGFDFRGAFLVAVSLALITLGATCRFLHPLVVWALPVGIVLLCLFVRREWHSPSPILDLRILAKVKGLPAGMAATFINYGSFMGLSVLFSLYLQQVLGLDAFKAGMVLMVQSVAQTLLSPWAGRLGDRYHPMLISTIGMAACGLSIFSFVFLGADSPVWLVAVLQACLGVGCAIFVAPNMSATLGNVPKANLPVASGLLGCLRTIGGLTSHIVVACMLGLFLGDAVVGQDSTQDFLLAMRWALGVFTLMNLSAVLIGVRSLKGRH